MFQTGFKGSLYWNRRGIYKIKEMRLRIILASVAMQELGHGTTGGAGIALTGHVVHEVFIGLNNLKHNYTAVFATTKAFHEF